MWKLEGIKWKSFSTNKKTVMPNDCPIASCNRFVSPIDTTLVILPNEHNKTNLLDTIHFTYSQLNPISPHQL